MLCDCKASNTFAQVLKCTLRDLILIVIKFKNYEISSNLFLIIYLIDKPPKAVVIIVKIHPHEIK